MYFLIKFDGVDFLAAHAPVVRYTVYATRNVNELPKLPLVNVNVAVFNPRAIEYVAPVTPNRRNRVTRVI